MAKLYIHKDGIVSKILSYIKKLLEMLKKTPLESTKPESETESIKIVAKSFNDENEILGGVDLKIYEKKEITGMRLYVVRQIYTDHSTLGRLLIGDKVFCYTLEDAVRKQGLPKVYGKTAIPAGHYSVIVNMSNTFKREMPLILNVPKFEGIRIHGGNTPEDTLGCILVAYNKVSDNKIYGTAEAAITEMLKSNEGEHTIDIIDTHPYYGIG